VVAAWGGGLAKEGWIGVRPAAASTELARLKILAQATETVRRTRGAAKTLIRMPTWPTTHFPKPLNSGVPWFTPQAGGGVPSAAFRFFHPAAFCHTRSTACCP
jgi:hypothetical protein